MALNMHGMGDDDDDDHDDDGCMYVCYAGLDKFKILKA
jgi:hypothetical protein